MSEKEKIDIDVFKVVTRAIGESDNLEIMTSHLTQLLVGTLDIKGCTIFALNPDTKELEILASFGLSISYLNKGPIVFDKSIGCLKDNESIVISDISKSGLLQYPDEAMKEGVVAIVSLPIVFYGETIGALRLYHCDPWEISEKDVDSLLLLAENIGLAMMYTRLLNAMQAVKDTVDRLPLELTPFFRR